MTLSCGAAIFRDDIGGRSWPVALLSGRFRLPPVLLSRPAAGNLYEPANLI
jgi:hypothetical protein